MTETLIKDYKVKLEVPECHPGSTSFAMFVTFQEDITEVLPYLNAELGSGADYRHKDGILLWNGEEKLHAFRAHEIAITSFEKDDEAHEFARKTVARVNDIWRRRAEITPSIKGRDPLPKVLDILKPLPKANCKKCGFPTCMAYAVELRLDPAKLSSCPHLSEQDYRRVLP